LTPEHSTPVELVTDRARPMLELLEIKAACMFDQERRSQVFWYRIALHPCRQAVSKAIFVQHLNRRLVMACLLQVIQ